MPEPVDFERSVARAIAKRFGTEVAAARYHDDDEKVSLVVVRGRDCPVEGVTSYGTSGLHRVLTPSANGEMLQCELVAACASVTPEIDNCVSSCVIEVLKNGGVISYGTYIENLVQQYAISETMAHVTFVSPFLWDDMNVLEVEGSKIYILMMVPISDAELDYLRENGIDALERMFTEHDIDIFDINRESVV